MSHLKNISYRPQAAENVLENDELRKKGLWNSVDLVEIQTCRVIRRTNEYKIKKNLELVDAQQMQKKKYYSWDYD